jgi:hypothetical protein
MSETRVQFSVHDTQWQWIHNVGVDAVRWRRQLVSILIALAPSHHVSLFTLVLRWLATSPGSNGTGMCADRYEWSGVYRCILVVPCTVLVEEAVVTMITIQRHPPILSAFLERLHEMTVDQWTEATVRHLFQNLPLQLVDVDRFVWATFFQPMLPRFLYTTIFSIHSHCEVDDHWCYYLRLHSGMTNTTTDAPRGSPLQRIVCNDTQPCDMGRLIDYLTARDNGIARRWVAAAFGHKPNDEACVSIPWDTIVCWIIGNVVIFTHQAGHWEMLSEDQQHHIDTLLLHRGNVPEYAAWFLRALIFHADTNRLCMACYRWWWRHGRIIIQSLAEQVVVLLPCLPQLVQRYQSVSMGGAQIEGVSELFGSVVFFCVPKRTTACDCWYHCIPFYPVPPQHYPLL